MFAGYTLIVFSDFTDSGETRYNFAWYLIGIVIVVCITNIGFQLKDSLQEVILIARKKYAASRQEYFSKFRKDLTAHRAEKKRRREFVNTLRSMSRARGNDPDLPDHTGRSLNEIWTDALE